MEVLKEKSLADQVIAEAQRDAIKDKVDAAKRKLTTKYKEKVAATQVLNNIEREIEDLELSIRQEFAE